MFKYLKCAVLLYCFSMMACDTTNNKPLWIGFSADSTNIVLKNIRPAELLLLKNHLETDSAYQKLVAVLQTPCETDSLEMEVEWPGKLVLDGDQLVFRPDQAFKKGKSYLVETIIDAQFASVKDVMRSNVGRNVKPSQKMLKR
jgi:hypothetical protein